MSDLESDDWLLFMFLCHTGVMSATTMCWLLVFNVLSAHYVAAVNNIHKNMVSNPQHLTAGSGQQHESRDYTAVNDIIASDYSFDDADGGSYI